MSIFKRITSFLLALVMVAGMLPMAHVHAEETVELPACQEEEIPVTSEIMETEAAETLPEETAAETVAQEAEAATVAWNLDDSGKLTITGTGEITGAPWLDRADYIRHVVIGEGITTIPAYAFEDCINLTSLELPATLKSVSANAFFGSRNIQKVSISDLKTWCAISWHSSLYCNPLEGGAALYVGGELVTQLVIPEGTTAVSAYAFVGCTSITDVVIPEGVTSIGEGAFQNCCNLETVSLPATLKAIGRSAFHSSSLKAVQLPEGLTTIGGYAFMNTDLEEITFPASVNLISASAFENCGNLTAITFRHDGEDPLMIGADAFRVYADTYTILQTISAEPNPAIADYDWAGSGRIFTNECEGEHTVVAEEDKAPTCTESGYVGKSWCAVCGKILSQREVVPALGHSEVIDAAVSPNCTETGLTEGKHCSRCSEVLAAQEVIPALGHTMIVDAYVAPTCLDAGLTEGSHCETCGEVLATQEEIPALGHDFVDGFCDRCGEADKADYEIFSGKNVTFMPIDPATGKAYTAKQLTWFLDERYESFAMLKNGKLTAKVVLSRTRMEVVAKRTDNGEIAAVYTVDIYPAVTQLEVKREGEIVNDKTIFMDTAKARLTLTAESYPLDTLENMTWSVSDKKNQYASYEIKDDTLTISNPTGKAGTVTIKATVDAGVKKTVTVKVSFGSYAKTVKIAESDKTILREGENLTLTAAITEPSAVTKPGIVWSTSDKSVATVSNGKVTAKTVAHPTTVTITATSKDGQAFDTIALTILPKNEGRLVLMQDGAYVTNSTVTLNAGETRQIAASSIINGAPVAEKVTWTSAKEAVAKVVDGKITAVGSGSTKITAAAADGRKAVINVKVTTLVSDITITTRDGKNLVTENGETIVEVASSKGVNLTATVFPQKASKAVTWEIIEGGAYAKISNGKLTANKDLTSVKYVTVRVTAKDGSGYAETIRIRIRPLATGVQIYSQQNGMTTFSVRTPENWWVRSNTTLEVKLSDTKTLQLLSHVYPYYGEDNARNAIQGVIWKSSSTKIATIDENGTVTFLKAGTVTITATAGDGSGKKVTFKLKIV